MANVGYASLSIIPVARGFQRQLQTAVGPGVRAAGRASGKDMGEAIALGLDDAKAAVSKASDGLAKARGKEEDASNKVRVAELKLQELRDSGRAKASSIEAAEGRLAKAKRDHTTATEQAESASKSLADANEQLAKASDDSAKATEVSLTGTNKLGEASNWVADRLDGLGGKLSALPGPAGEVGGALGTVADKFRDLGDSSTEGTGISREKLLILAAGAGTAAATITTALYKIGGGFNDVSNTIRVGTGASGDDLAALEDSAARIGTTIPVAFGDAGEAVSILNTATGAGGDSLERLSTQVLNASRLLGEDGATAAENYGKVLNQWSMDADEGAAAMDSLFKVTQDYGSSFGDLTGQLNSYGSVLQNAGFTMEDSAVLFGKLDKAGLSVSRVMPGLNKAFRDWAAEGKDVKATLTEQVEAIKNAESSTEGLAIATETFGAQGAARLTTGIRNGSFAIDDLAGSLEGAEGSIDETDRATRTFAESWQILKNKGLDAIRGPATEVFGIITDAVTGFTDWVTSIDGATDVLAGLGKILVPMVGTALAIVGAVKAWAAAQAILNAVMAANPIGLIVVALAGLVAGLVLAYQNSETFRNIVQAAWAGVQAAVSFAWENVIRPAFEALRAGLSHVGEFFTWLWNNAVTPAWNGISALVRAGWENVIRPTWDALRAALGAVGRFFQDTWNNVIKPAWDALGAGIRWVVDNVVTPAWDAMNAGLDVVKDSFSKAVDWIGQVWDRVRGAVAKPIKFVIDGVYNNGIVAAWNKVADWIPGVDTLDTYTPDWLGAYNTGGIVPGYTPGRDTGIIAAGGGEAVMRPEWTAAVGHDYVHEANAAARSGGREGVARFLGAYAGGGVVPAMTEIVKQKYPGMTLTDSYRPGAADLHGAGLATDWSNGQGNTPMMLSLANDIADTYPGSAELIYDDPRFDRNIKNGQQVGRFGEYYTMGQAGPHHHHVHWGMTEPPTMPFGGGVFEGGSDGSGGGFVQFLRNRVADAFDAIMRPIGESIAGKFSGRGVESAPSAMFDKFRDDVRAFLVGEAEAHSPAAGGAVEPGTGPVAEQVKEAFAAYGWDKEPYWSATDWIVGKESGWDPTAVNPSSGAFGLFQFNPMGGDTLGAYLPDRNPNPKVQGAAGARYIADRYGTPLEAKAFWEANGWYDDGGIAEGTGLMLKNVIQPERVLSPRQTANHERLTEALEGDKPMLVEVINWPEGMADTGTSSNPAPAPAPADNDTGDVDTGDQAEIPEAATTPEATAVDTSNAAGPFEAAGKFIDDNRDDMLETLAGLGLGITVNNYGGTGVGAWRRAADRQKRKVRLSNR